MITSTFAAPSQPPLHALARPAGAISNLDCQYCFFAPDGEPGLYYLCTGYKAFFTHIDEPTRFMARELAVDQAPANAMAYMQAKDARLGAVLPRPGRNDPCPCGSG